VSRKSKNSNRGTGDFLAFLSFVAVMLLGLAFALARLFGWLADITEIFDFGVTAARWIQNIAIAVALIIPLALSFRVARKKGTLWFILWLIAVVLVVVFYVWGAIIPF